MILPVMPQQCPSQCPQQALWPRVGLIDLSKAKLCKKYFGTAMQLAKQDWQDCPSQNWFGPTAMFFNGLSDCVKKIMQSIQHIYMGSNFWRYKILYRERIFQNTEESKQNILHICRGLFTLFQISRFRDVMCQQTAQLEPHRTPAYLFNHQHSPICSLELGGFVIFVINNLQNTEKANYDVLHCFCIWLSMFLNATIGLVPHNFLVCDGPTLEKFFLPSWMESRSLER